MKRLLAFVSAPWVVCVLSFIVGAALLVAGVYVLAGFGWALLVSSIPALAVGYVTLRGLARG